MCLETLMKPKALRLKKNELLYIYTVICIYMEYGRIKFTSHVSVLTTTILNNLSTHFAQLIRTVA